MKLSKALSIIMIHRLYLVRWKPRLLYKKSRNCNSLSCV